MRSVVAKASAPKHGVPAAASSQPEDGLRLIREKVLHQVAIGAFGDIRGFYDERGDLIPPHKLSYEQAAMIEGIEHTPIFEGSGQERRFVGNKVTYKIAKRAQYIDMAMKHLGEYKRDNEQAGQALVGSLAELVNGMKGSTLPVVAGAGSLQIGMDR